MKIAANAGIAPTTAKNARAMNPWRRTMTENQFTHFKARVERLLHTRHGITLNDCTDEAHLRSVHSAGDTPEEFLDRIASKYDLDRIDLGPYGEGLGKRNDQ
jgi:hypothetical protein